MTDSTDMLDPSTRAINERLNREIRRRTDVFGILPDRSSMIRLLGAGHADSTTTGPKAAATSGSTT